eukprot:scaffold3720_cov141-Cylindrotheca_fusiformis.AAC.18
MCQAFSFQSWKDWERDGLYKHTIASLSVLYIAGLESLVPSGTSPVRRQSYVSVFCEAVLRSKTTMMMRSVAKLLTTSDQNIQNKWLPIARTNQQCLITTTNAWISSPRPSVAIGQRKLSILSSSTTTNENSNPPGLEDAEEDDEDVEYEYVEYDILTESDFLSSEWLVGTCMDRSPNRIVETWVRLAVDKDGKNVAIWGDKSQGKWNFDTASQFLSMSKENILGKDIWAGVVDDYYYAQGTVRGWSFFAAAAVVGQWQAKRLGVDPEEAGIAPWFQQEDEDDTPSASEGEGNEDSGSSS